LEYNSPTFSVSFFSGFLNACFTYSVDANTLSLLFKALKTEFKKILFFTVSIRSEFLVHFFYPMKRKRVVRPDSEDEYESEDKYQKNYEEKKKRIEDLKQKSKSEKETQKLEKKTKIVEKKISIAKTETKIEKLESYEKLNMDKIDKIEEYL
jgi:uncharacterized protein YlxW (UPF0749 family)